MRSNLAVPTKPSENGGVHLHVSIFEIRHRVGAAREIRLENQAIGDVFAPLQTCDPTLNIKTVSVATL
jgi:hypothetical protein